MAAIEPPRPLEPDDDPSGFDCGNASLNDWLTATAKKSAKSGAARTYVSLSVETGKVAAYYCLAAGSVARARAKGQLARNSPDPVPVIVLGRLAVALDFQTQGIGKVLIADALNRSVAAAEQIGARAIVVNPIDAAAADYYQQRGFSRLPKDPGTLYMTISSIRAILPHY